MADASCASSWVGGRTRAGSPHLGDAGLHRVASVHWRQFPRPRGPGGALQDVYSGLRGVTVSLPQQSSLQKRTEKKLWRNEEERGEVLPAPVLTRPWRRHWASRADLRAEREKTEFFVRRRKRSRPPERNKRNSGSPPARTRGACRKAGWALTEDRRVRRAWQRSG
ncbi:hypothetical protein NDU88_006767 [Pleurodeles waltl]|uniref:Uncharacterized protein n=1 Tax=Pleurodeles waltl TaxID=8319 RepID=A0AAV7LRR4_PLEWA|nr:hypothetical protein NDU88_006767 [Pleurodeles waltl]